jgi:hypothetical protein
MYIPPLSTQEQDQEQERIRKSIIEAHLLPHPNHNDKKDVDETRNESTGLSQDGPSPRFSPLAIPTHITEVSHEDEVGNQELVQQWREEMKGIPGCVLPDEYDEFIPFSPLSPCINPVTPD